MSFSLGYRPIRSLIAASFLTIAGVLSVSSAAQAQATFSTQFNPTTIGPGGGSVLTYTIDNGSGAPITDLAFTNVLPTVPGDVDIATPSSASTDCSGPGGVGLAAISAPDGGGTISMADGSLGAFATCTVTVNVTASTPGAHTNPAVTLNSSVGSSISSPHDLTVSAALPGFTKAFAPSSVSLGGSSTLTYTIDNSANAARIGNLDFTETFPSGLQVASPANASTNCVSARAPNTTLTATPGGSSITLDANGANFFAGFEVLGAGATCTVSVDVTATGVGLLTATSSALLADFVSAGTSTATLDVTAAALNITKSFLTNPVNAGDTTTLRFTIENFNRGFSATGVAFTDDLAAALSGLTYTSLSSNDCGGSVAGVGTTDISFSGGTIAAGSTCTIDASLSVPVGATGGNYSNTTSTVTGTVDGNPVTGNAATAALVVPSGGGAPSVALSISPTAPLAGDTITLNFSIDNNSTTSAATDLGLVLDLAPPLPFPLDLGTLPTAPCGAGSSISAIFPDTNAQSLSLTNGTIAAGGSCNFSVDLTLSGDMPGGSVTVATDAPTATVDGSTVTGTGDNASFNVAGGLNLNFIKFFSQTAAPGGTVDLTFRITGGDDSGGAEAISFTDDLTTVLTGLSASATPVNECGGTMSGTTTLSYSGGTLAAGASCDITVTLDVPAGAAAGNYENTTSLLSAEPAGGGTPVTFAEAQADLSVAGLDFSKEFLGDPTIAGDTLTLRYTIANQHPSDPATITSFTDNLNAALSGLTATGPASVDTCGGTLSGTTFLIYTGGSVAAGNSCTIDVPILVPAGAADGDYGSVSSSLSANQGGAVAVDPAFDTLIVQSATLLFSKAFTDDPVFAGTPATLEFTIENLAGQATSALSFTDDLGAMLVGTTFDSELFNDCGATVAGTGTDTITVSAGTIAADATCTIRVSTTPSGAAMPGLYSNTTSRITGTAGGFPVDGDPATDDLEVFSAAGPTFSKSFTGPVQATGTTQLTFTIANPAGGAALAILSFLDNLDSVLPGLTASNFPAAPCGAGSSISGGSILALSNGSLDPGASCVFSVDVTAPETAAAGSFSSTTSDLQSGGLTVATPATANLIVEPSPTFAKNFGPSSIAQGDKSTLTFTIDNADSALAVSALAFTDNLPAAVTVASSPAPTNTCGGTLTAVNASGTISLSGGSVGAGASCTLTVPVTAIAVGNHLNTTGDLTSSAGNSGTASDTLTVTAAPPPAFAKVFGPNSVVQGAVSTLTFTIDNSTALTAAGSLAFTDNLPTGMSVATTPNASSTCAGGTITAAAGSTSVSYSGGSVAALDTCTLVVDVTSSTAGPANNVSGALTSTLGTSSTASATLTVTPAPVPVVSKSFIPATIAQGGTSVLSVTIENVSLIDATNVSIVDNLPSGMTVASPENRSLSCTGVAVGSSASDRFGMNGGEIPAGSTCVLSIDVTSTAVGNAVNTTNDATSSLGTSPGATATLTVTAAPAPLFSKDFAPATISQGETSQLTFTIDNSATLIDVTALDFTDTLPAGLTIADPAVTTTTCNSGTLTATAGTGTITYTGGTVLASDTCTLTVDVTSVTVGAAVNTSGDLTSAQGNSGPASATLTVSSAPAPAFGKSFAPASIPQGAVSTLTFNIDNTAALVAATALDFTDNLPAGMTVANPANASTTCTSGTLTAADGTGTITYSGGNVATRASCTVSVDVTSATVGSAANLTGDLTSSSGNSGTAAASLTVTSAGIPAFSKAFNPASIVQGEDSILTFTLDNSGNLVPATAVDFTDTFPAAMLISGSTPASTDCTGGTLTAAAGSGTVSYTGGTIPINASCTIEVNVTSSISGAHVNSSGDMTSSLGNSGSAGATLTVTTAPEPGFSKVFTPASIPQGGTSVLMFTIDNNAALVDATALAFSDTFPAGMTVANPPNASSTCTGGTVTAITGDTTMGFANGAVAANGTCTVQVDVTSDTVGAAANTSETLTSSLGNSGTATATLTVNAAPAPGFAKAFAPNSIVEGATSTLIFTIDNGLALIEATGLGFTDTFPAGLTIASPANASSTCTGGTVTAAAGAGSLTYASGTADAAATCTVQVDVTSTTRGDSISVSGELTSSLGNSGAATATLTVTSAAPPSFSKSFSPSSIAQGDVSTLTFTIDNSAAPVDATALDFVDNLPTGLTIATSANSATTCTGGTITAASGSGTFAYTGGTVLANATCTVEVDLTSTIVGDVANTTGDLTSSLGNSGSATATLTVIAAAAPDFTQAFAPPTIIQDGVSRLVFTVDNGAALIPATSLNFSNTLPANVTVSPAPNPTTTCGGSIRATAGKGSLAFSGGSVAASSTCEIAVDVTSTVAGTYPNTPGNLSSSLGTSTPGAASLTVNADPNGRVTFIQQSSEDSAFGFSSSEAPLNFIINTSGGTGSVGPIDVPVGRYTVTQSRPAGVGNSTITCSDSDSSGDPKTGVITLNVASFENVTCTISSINSRQKTVDTINSFLNRRNNLILSNQPNRSRRMDRLNTGGTGVQRLSYQNGDLGSLLPFTTNLTNVQSLGSGNYQFSTSVSQAVKGHAKFMLAHDGDPESTHLINNRKFDVWLETNYNKFEASQGSGGHFTIAYLGADYLLNPNLLVGALIQYDELLDSSAQTNSRVHGKGWMIAPYMTTQLAPNLYFDGRIAYGQSSNKISPFKTYTDTFKTDRWMVNANLSGNFDLERWQISPNINVAYIEENQKAYVDTLNVRIPGQTVGLGQLRFGPDFSTVIHGRNHSIIEPRFTLDGIYNFGNRSGNPLVNNTSNEADGWRARFEAGASFTNRHGVQLQLGANYDGIGQSDFESYGGSVKLTFPLN